MPKAIPDFHFVDRCAEREQIGSFLYEPTDVNGSNVMWLRGQERSGVSRLLNDVLASLENQSDYLIIKLEVNNDGGVQSLEHLLELTMRHSDTKPSSLLRFIPPSIMGVSSICQAMLPTEAAFPAAITGFINFLLQYDGFRSRRPAAQIAPYQVLVTLLRKIHLHKGQKTVVAIDDYHLANDLVADCYESIMAELIDADEFRFILASSGNDENSPNLSSRLVERFFLKSVMIVPFSEPEHFRSILSGCFSDVPDTDSAVTEVFIACSKSPGKLRQRYLEYTNNAADLPSYSGFVDFIRSLNTRSNLNSNEEQLLAVLKVLDSPTEKTLLPELGELIKATYSSLQDAAQHVLTLQMLDAMHSLMQRGHIRENADGFLIIDAAEAPDVPTRNIRITAQTLVNLSNGLVADFLRRYIDEAHLTWAEASVFYYANEELACGESYAKLFEILTKSGDKAKAQIALERMLEQSQYVPPTLSLLTKMATFSYENGRYGQALKLLELGGEIDPEQDSSNLAYNRFMLKGKSMNALGQLEKAEWFLSNAEKSAFSSDTRLQAKAMRQLVIREITGREAEAEHIFHTLYEGFAFKDQWSAAECFVARIKVDYWKPGDDTTRVLRRALDESQRKGFRENLPYLEIAIGLQSLRENDRREAFSHFQKAQEHLSSTRPHEQAYAYNDMGVCSLLEGDYDQALTFFRKGNAWASTPYIRSVLLANRAISLALLGRKEDARAFCLDMTSLLDEATSSLVQTRLRLAICFVCLVNGDTSPYRVSNYSAIYAEEIRWLKENLEVGSRQYRRALDIDWNAQRMQGEYIREIAGAEFDYHEAPFQPWIATLHHD